MIWESKALDLCFERWVRQRFFFWMMMMGSAKAFFFFRMMKMGSAEAEEESCVEVGFFLDQKQSGIFHQG